MTKQEYLNRIDGIIEAAPDISEFEAEIDITDTDIALQELEDEYLASQEGGSRGVTL
jgi:hypothetical protein